MEYFSIELTSKASANQRAGNLDWRTWRETRETREWREWEECRECRERLGVNVIMLECQVLIRVIILSGRAGRTGPGWCYRLYSSAAFNTHFPEFAPPEILKAPIDSVVLSMKNMGIEKVRGL
jgi:hypothetical protein